MNPLRSHWPLARDLQSSCKQCHIAKRMKPSVARPSSRFFTNSINRYDFKSRLGGVSKDKLQAQEAEAAQQARDVEARVKTLSSQTRAPLPRYGITALQSDFESRFSRSPQSTSLYARQVTKRPSRPHKLHIYATKHNTHVTLSDGVRNPVLSVSTGQLNFRKAHRGTYDAAFQLGAYVLARIKNMGLLDNGYTGRGGPIRQLEIVFRDFGIGREALSKLLLGGEGKELKSRVIRVMDSTRLKQGGTRSPNPRRL